MLAIICTSKKISDIKETGYNSCLEERKSTAFAWGYRGRPPPMGKYGDLVGVSGIWKVFGSYGTVCGLRGVAGAIWTKVAS